jgi:hypothetical protein
MLLNVAAGMTWKLDLPHQGQLDRSGDGCRQGGLEHVDHPRSLLPRRRSWHMSNSVCFPTFFFLSNHVQDGSRALGWMTMTPLLPQVKVICTASFATANTPLNLRWIIMIHRWTYLPMNTTWRKTQIGFDTIKTIHGKEHPGIMWPTSDVNSTKTCSGQNKGWEYIAPGRVLIRKNQWKININSNHPSTILSVHRSDTGFSTWKSKHCSRRR